MFSCFLPLNLNKKNYFFIVNIKKGEKIIEEINLVVKSWNEYANKAKVKPELQQRIYKNLNVLKLI